MVSEEVFYNYRLEKAMTKVTRAMKACRWLRNRFIEACAGKNWPLEIDYMMLHGFKKDPKQYDLLLELNFQPELAPFIRTKWNKYNDEVIEIFVPSEKKEEYNKTKEYLKQNSKYRA